jgi:WD40 repeat protein
MLLLKGKRGRIDHLAFAPSGLTLATAGIPKKSVIQIWDLVERTPPSLLGPLYPLKDLTFLKDDATLLLHWRDEHLWLWDLMTRKARPLLEERAAVRAYALADNGESLFLALYSLVMHGGHRLAIRQIDLSTWQDRPHVEQVFADPFAAVAIRPGRPFLAAVQLQPARLARILVVAPGRNAREVDVPRSAKVVSLTFTPGGHTLAVRTLRSVRLWDVKAAKTLAKVKESATIHATAFSPDGGTLATANEDGAVHFYDVTTGHKRAAFDWQIGPIYSLAFAPDGMRAAAGGSKGTIVIWDVDG